VAPYTLDGPGHPHGSLFGFQSSGRRAVVTGITILRSDGKQIQEEWTLWEQLALLQQLGLAKF
jgi:predicted ester cyclase